jgi:hypothetical protein
MSYLLHGIGPTDFRCDKFNFMPQGILSREIRHGGFHGYEFIAGSRRADYPVE